MLVCFLGIVKSASVVLWIQSNNYCLKEINSTGTTVSSKALYVCDMDTVLGRPTTVLAFVPFVSRYSFSSSIFQFQRHFRRMHLSDRFVTQNYNMQLAQSIAITIAVTQCSFYETCVKHYRTRELRPQYLIRKQEMQP